MKRLFFFLSFFSCLPAIAQNKILTMEEAILKARTTLAPENLKQLQFIYGTDDYVYLKKVDGKDVWMKGSNKTNETPFLTLEQLNAKLKAGALDTTDAMPVIQFNQSPDWIVTVNKNKLGINTSTNKIKTIIAKSISDKQNAEESKAGYIAYLDSFNLYVSTGKEAKQVTQDGSKDIVYASSVHREEFGIVKGTFWSNNGKVLAFYRMDQGMVADYPIIDWSKQPAKSENIKYPMAGGISHHVTVGVYNAETKSLLYLKTGEPADQYLTNITWSPDDKFIYIAVLNRGQDHLKLNQYNASTGALIKTLYEETDEKYVEPLVPILFVKNNPNQYILQSNRDGWNHLYLFDINGKFIKRLTTGKWEVLEVKGFDAGGENLFYVSTAESPITKNLYQVNLLSGVTKRVTENPGVHNTQVSSDGNFVLDVSSTVDNPRTVQLIETKTGKVKLLLQSANPLNDYATGKLNIFTIKNDNATELYCRS